MSVSELSFRSCASSGGQPLISLVDNIGRIQIASDHALATLGLDEREVIGHNWREFAAEKGYDEEQKIVDRVWWAEQPAYLLSFRQYGNRRVKLVQRMSLSKTSLGGRLLLREAFLLEGGATDDFIKTQLDTLRQVASESGSDVFNYLIEMAMLQRAKDLSS